MQIASKIEKYEEENNTTITKIALNYVFDENSHQIPEIGYSQKYLGLYGTSEIKFYTNKYLEKIIFEDEIKQKYFEEKEDKIVCIEDTVYVQIKV